MAVDIQSIKSAALFSDHAGCKRWFMKSKTPSISVRYLRQLVPLVNLDRERLPVSPGKHTNKHTSPLLTTGAEN